MRFQVFIAIVINYWLLFILSFSQAMIFKFTNAICESYNKSWITVEECRLRAISRNMTTFDMQLDLHYPVNNCFVMYEIFKKANGYKPWLYKANIDACMFLRKPYHPIAIIVYRLVRNFSNFNHTCPYVGLATIKGFYLRSEILPMVLPTGDYMVSMKWSIDRKPQLLVNIYTTFVEDL